MEPTTNRPTISMAVPLIALVITLLTVGSCFARCQDCASLNNAASPDLVSYLSGIVPDAPNEQCITQAIGKLGSEHYEPAIAVLARLLDFRRPPDEREKRGFVIHLLTIWNLYPAAGALDLIGRKASPEVLRVIELDSTSTTARENAVAVWMGMYKYEQPKGIGLLKDRLDQATDAASKQKLRWAMTRALKWCNPADESACREASISK